MWQVYWKDMEELIFYQKKEQNQFPSSFKPWAVEIYQFFTCITATSFTEIKRRISYVLDDDFERGETN